ncbi:MAG: hypothetical protein AB7P40_30895 [Chloroflexota bacterium]
MSASDDWMTTRPVAKRKMCRVAAWSLVASLAALVLLAGAGGVVQAQEECGGIYVDTYTPVVNDCGSWGVKRFPDRPTRKDGRWVIQDDGLEFTLMSNVNVRDYNPKDRAMWFFKSKGVQVRFGAAQPFDGSEPTAEYRQQHLGLYVESEYVGEWQQFGLPMER